MQTFVLNDQDASSVGWSVSGADAGDFEISSDGALSFKSSPNYESPADTGGDNTYNVTVSRSGGSLDVVVTVTNVDEAGSVSLDDLQPQAGAVGECERIGPGRRPLGDGVAVVEVDGHGGVGGHSWSYVLDVRAVRFGRCGYYLRATATYSDGLETGRDSASAESAFAVEARPASNNQPSFGVQDEDPVEPDNQVTRTVKETAKVGSSVGNAVTATDTDNDPLLYSLTDGDGNDTGTASRDPCHPFEHGWRFHMVQD